MSKRRLTILEYENGFVMPLKQVAVAQGNGAFLKQEVAMMIQDELDAGDDVEVLLVKVKGVTTIKVYFGESDGV